MDTQSFMQNLIHQFSSDGLTLSYSISDTLGQLIRIVGRTLNLFLVTLRRFVVWILLSFGIESPQNFFVGKRCINHVRIPIQTGWLASTSCSVLKVIY